MSGTPLFDIDINEPITKLGDKNPEMLIIYMAGYTKYALENPAETNKQKIRIAAVKAVLAKYQSDKSCKKDKGLDNLIKMDQQGTLDAWVAHAFA
jgi:hypothetical protein